LRCVLGKEVYRGERFFDKTLQGHFAPESRRDLGNRPKNAILPSCPFVRGWDILFFPG